MVEATTELSPLDALIREHLGGEDHTERYSIATRHPDDPEAQGRLAAWHLARIKAERDLSATEFYAINEAIKIQEALLEALKRKLCAIQDQCDERTRHDRAVIADWMREAEHIRNAKRNSLDLGVARVGTRTYKARERIDCDSETLAAMFPDLTVPRLTDKREAVKRLKAENGNVYVAETGELVEGATVATVPEQVTVYAEFGPDRVVLETLRGQQALSAPEGGDTDGE